jgi:hypothetical protein
MWIAEKNHPYHPVTNAPALHFVSAIADVSGKTPASLADDRLDFLNPAPVLGCVVEIPVVPAEGRFHELNNTKFGGLSRIKYYENLLDLPRIVAARKHPGLRSTSDTGLVGWLRFFLHGREILRRREIFQTV